MKSPRAARYSGCRSSPRRKTTRTGPRRRNAVFASSPSAPARARPGSPRAPHAGNPEREATSLSRRGDGEERGAANRSVAAANDTPFRLPGVAAPENHTRDRARGAGTRFSRRPRARGRRQSCLPASVDAGSPERDARSRVAADRSGCHALRRRRARQGAATRIDAANTTRARVHHRRRAARRSGCRPSPRGRTRARTHPAAPNVIFVCSPSAPVARKPTSPRAVHAGRYEGGTR